MQMTPTVKTYIDKLEELLKMQEKSFVYEMTGEGSGLDWNNEFIPFANKLKDELSFLKQQIEAEEKTVSDKRKFTHNDIDLAYCAGIFNTGGIDILAKELERLKHIKMKPHQIFERNRDKLLNNQDNG